MEEVKKENHQGCPCDNCPHKDHCKMGTCGAGMCGGMGFHGCGMRRFRILRLIIGIIIVAALIGLGMKMGELKTMCGMYRGGGTFQTLPFGR